MKLVDVKMVPYLLSMVEVCDAKALVMLLPPNPTVFQHMDDHTEEQLSHDSPIDSEAGRCNNIVGAPEPEPSSCPLKGEMVKEFSSRMESNKLSLLRDYAMAETLDMVSSKEVEAQQLAYDNSVLEPTMGRAMYIWVNFPDGYQLQKLVL